VFSLLLINSFTCYLQYLSPLT